MRFSVIIPTYNRSEKLKECLKALFAQEYDAAEFEIIVVDDGSRDSTQAVLKKLQKSAPVPLTALAQSNQGQGVARNRGIEHAKGEIILLLGDDIIAEPMLLQEHDKIHLWHGQENAAVLGFITWHPRLLITPLMRFMERGGAILGRFGGHQFAYDLLEGARTADYRFFYTSNISLKRSLLLRFKFDPWFSGYGWEDVELGYRLQKQASLTLFYNKDAAAYHDHEMNEEDFVRRMRAIGAASHRIHARYPELGRVPSKKKQLLLRCLSSRAVRSFFRPFSKNLYFYALSKKYFLEGLKEGYNGKQV